MSYEKQTPGLAYHFKNLHLNYDQPPAYTFLPEPMHTSFHDDMPELATTLGQHRLPRHRPFAAKVLWNFWEPGMDQEEMLDEGLRMERRRRFLSKVVLSHIDNNDCTDIQYIIQEWFYLRTKIRITSHMDFLISCQRIISFFPPPPPSITQPQLNVQDGFRMLKKENILFDLEHVVRWAEEEYESSTRCFAQGEYRQAGNHCLAGLMALGPWYPSEYFMPAWEALGLGFAQVYFNLTRTLVRVILQSTATSKWYAAASTMQELCKHPFSTNHHTKLSLDLYVEIIESIQGQVWAPDFAHMNIFQHVVSRMFIAEEEAIWHGRREDTTWRSELGGLGVWDVLQTALEIGDFGGRDTVVYNAVERMLRGREEGRLREVIYERAVPEVDVELGEDLVASDGE